MQFTKEVDQFLSVKRANKNEKKRKRLWKEEKSRRREALLRALAFGKRSKIIKMIADEYDGDIDNFRGAMQLTFPPTFSIIESPDTVLGVMGMFANAVRKQRIKQVSFNHAALKDYDLAANGVLGVIAVELNQESRITGRRYINWRGTFPKDKEVQRFIRALGIIKQLALEKFYPPPDEVAELRMFDVRSRHYYRPGRPYKADFKTRIVANFAEHIDKCLNDHGRSMTQEARHKLCEYTGEIIGNSEEHAGMVDWTIQGYLDNAANDPICEIAIFNFGNTIAQTFKSLPSNHYTIMQIAPYMSAHRRFKFFGSNWSEEDLYTLIALQGQVSSKNQSPADTRGNGTVDLIEFFQKVHSECGHQSPIKAKMAILSGGTHILFDGTYKLVGKTIAFNKGNDLHERPDAEFVKRIKGYRFPGTVISIRFPLSATSTKQVGAK